MSSLDEAQYSALVAFARTRAGLALAPAARAVTEARVQQAAAAAGASTSSLLTDACSRPHGERAQLLLEALTVHETRFFRDESAFDVLARHVLPELLEARRTERSLTVWSAACSTGQEAYSLAMVLREGFPQLRGWTVRIVATDVSGAVVERVRDGRYSGFELSRGLSPVRRSRWFPGDRAAPELREVVDVRTMNLNGTWPSLPRFDLVLLRNVLVYFDTPTRRTLLDRVRQVLRPDGYLLLGHGETLVGVDPSWQADGRGGGFFRRGSEPGVPVLPAARRPLPPVHGAWPSASPFAPTAPAPRR